MKKNKRIPSVHPGEILKEEFMKPMGLSAYALAKATATTPITISQIIRGKRGLSAEMALRLGHYFGMSPEFWQGLQADYNLETTALECLEEIEHEVVPLHFATA